jgi:hypothetical protein
MPRSPSWIDPEAFAGLDAPRPPEARPAPDALPERERREPAASPAPAREPIAPPPSAEPTPPPATATVPAASLEALETRVRLFRQWMRTLVGDRPFFLTDADGHVLLTERVAAERVVAGPVLERALRILRPFIGAARARSAHVQLEDGQLLQMVWHRTARGRVGLGVFGDPVLDPARVQWVERALEKVFAVEPS